MNNLVFISGHSLKNSVTPSSSMFIRTFKIRAGHFAWKVPACFLKPHPNKRVTVFEEKLGQRPCSDSCCHRAGERRHCATPRPLYNCFVKYLNHKYFFYAKELQSKSHMLIARGKGCWLFFFNYFLWFVFHLLAPRPVSAGDTHRYWQTARAAGSLPQRPVQQPVTLWWLDQVTQTPWWDSSATKDWGFATEISHFTHALESSSIQDQHFMLSLTIVQDIYTTITKTPSLGFLSPRAWF